MSELVEETVSEDEDVPVEHVAQTAVVRRRRDAGMVSAEWAVGIIAAIAVAGVLLTVVTSGGVRVAMLQFILHVIQTFSSQN